MRIARQLLAGAAAFGLIGGVANPSLAATATGQLTVQATIADACSIGGGTLDFGSPVGISTSDGATSVAPDATGEADISYACTNGTAATVSGASANSWSMTGPGTDKVAYKLTTDEQGTQPFDEEHSASVTGTGSAATLKLYGTIAGADLNKQVGAYQDTVTLTITY